MDRRAVSLRIVGGAGLAILAWGVWTVSQEAGLAASGLGLIGLVGLGLVFAYLAGGRRGRLASSIAGLVGGAMAWSLAALAMGVRSLCWGNPDQVARGACDTRWFIVSAILFAVGVLSIIVGFWRSGRAGARPG